MTRAFRFVAFWVVAASFAHAATFTVDGTGAGPWTKILGSVGVAEGGQMGASIVVLGDSSQADPMKLAEDQIVIVQGNTPATQALGFHAKSARVAVRQICDVHAPRVQIIWEQAVSVPEEELPWGFQVFAREKWKGIPVLAGKRTPHGAILWMATEPGPTGMERYPYLIQALADLGLQLPVRSTTLWAFFDSAYRIRADVDYLAQRWRAAGISELHVAAWHNMEPDPVRDEYLKELIEACHRHAILVYAWLELPHVSEKFWADHPAWRELPKIQAHHSTLLVEDPATLWDLGPDRYAKLAKKYAALTPDHDHIAVDINVVERYQDVYPTKKQTGVELLELVHQAAESFGQVALYFEHSLEKQDLPLLSVAASTAQVTTKNPDELQIEAKKPTRILWEGPAQVDGRTWPIQDAHTVLIPAGQHTLSRATKSSPITIADFNGNIRSAMVASKRVDLAYDSASRAIAVLNASPSSVEVDGMPYKETESGPKPVLVLPAGQHVVTLDR